MIKVSILVEGPTEETFIKRVVYPYLLPKDIFIIPKLVNTKRVNDGPNSKGGLGSYGKVKFEVVNLLRDTSVTVVTTMFDYYGLPKTFPSYNNVPNGDCYTKVEFLEKEFQKDIGDKRFLPYLSIHEFEALLFVAPELISQAFPGTKSEKQLLAIKHKFNDSPERINNSAVTAPSKRLMTLFPGYQKVLHGSVIAVDIGIDRIRAECPHFHEWLSNLENL